MKAMLGAMALTMILGAPPRSTAAPGRDDGDRDADPARSMPASRDDGSPLGGRGSEASWFAGEWRDYRRRFVAPDGRVVDNANGGVSHSEGQGYGLLLAEAAGDETGFATIWDWTRRHLYVRPDGLASWKWDPVHDVVADANNATDGDILVAWALDRGSKRFRRPDYAEAAKLIAHALGREVVVPGPQGPLLMPGVVGFDATAQSDGPILNLSYYVFPAFATLQALDPETDWQGVRDHGLAILKQSRFGPLRLPTDWVTIGTGLPRPAERFPPTFGYDAIRIPLYLAWAGRIDEERAHRFGSLWDERDDLGPFVIDVATGSSLHAFDGAGYRLVAAVAACAVKNVQIPRELISRRDELYYPATLRLLALVAIQERLLRCH